MSTIGIMYKQPRVFAHDAHPVVLGAINSTWNINDKIKWPLNWGGITVTSPGTGGAGNDYEVGMVLTMGGSATGSGVTVTVDAVDINGLITDYHISAVGAAYLVGDSLTQTGVSAPAGGLGFTCDVSNIDIPNTQEAGCCLYFSSAAAADVSLIMEAGTYDGSANNGYPAGDIKTFELVPVGSFMPILVKQVTSAIASAGDILALY